MAEDEKKEFKGELKRIDPKLLVSKSNEDNLEDFFLTLGLVFNDLKGLVLFIKLLDDHFRKPAKDEVSVHAGNYGGVMVQIVPRLIVSTVHEFFKLLEKNQGLLRDNEFMEILNKLSKADKNLWDGLFAAARGDLSNLSDFFKKLLRIRNNLGFHYYDSGKTLRRGYKSFFGRERRGKNEHAYFSLGETVETTRLFFSDAAADEATQLLAGKEEKGEENYLLEKYREQLLSTVDVLNLAIVKIFGKYIQVKRNQPH